jgi:head-tail adaptor
MAAQAGETRFVWGKHAETGEPWLLREDSGEEAREFVRAHIVCPVPGCSSQLTSVHSRVKRDHLRHPAGIAGHAPETLLHAQGCAIIQHWLSVAYPNSRVRREEYSNENGERRADVLLTGPMGHRVAFEIQFSAITESAWQGRHDSYQRQGIQDVWLFGNTRTHLRTRNTGELKLAPVHEAVIAAGQTLLFIDPDPIAPMIGYAVGDEKPFDKNGFYQLSVATVGSSQNARLSLEQLTAFRPDPGHGITSAALADYREAGAKLRSDNERARKAAAREEAIRRQRYEVRERDRRVRRGERIAQIRQLLGTSGKWESAWGSVAARGYFAGYLASRIPWERGKLSFWRSVVYFDLVAGKQGEPFDIRDATGALAVRGVTRSVSEAEIEEYLRWLLGLGLVVKADDGPGPPRYTPTRLGAWS